MALLKKALVAETAAATAGVAGMRPLLDAAGAAAGSAGASPSAEEDAVSALFELSSSVC